MAKSLRTVRTPAPLYRVEFYTDRQHQHRYRVVHRNRKIILDCAEGYRRSIDAQRAFGRFVVAVQTGGAVVVTGTVSKPKPRNRRKAAR